jgi:hypothetical protein
MLRASAVALLCISHLTTAGGDRNRTNPNEPSKGVITRSAVQLESNGVKGESQEKNFPGDWKEQRFLPGSPAHVMLGGSWVSLFSQIHVAVVTTSSVSDATSSTVAKNANHGSI